MPYLIQSDYLKEIQPAQLTQLIAGDTSILYRAELEAIEKATSYLSQKYDTAGEFTNTALWSSAVAYPAGSRVYVTDNNVDTLYYARYPDNVFDVNAYYNQGDKVYWNGRRYECLQSTVGTDQDTALQYSTYNNLPALNIYPDDTLNGTANWGNLGAYTVPAGTLLTDTAYWTQGDNRSQELLTHIINIALYRLMSRIAPMNMPKQREKLYNEALDWLTGAATGTITPSLPRVQPARGARIRWGGNIKNINTY